MTHNHKSPLSQTRAYIHVGSIKEIPGAKKEGPLGYLYMHVCNIHEHRQPLSCVFWASMHVQIAPRVSLRMCYL